jgi:putative MATE family efflux protein
MRDLTTRSVTQHLLKTASFMLVTMVFQTLYFLIDLYWVGRLGKEAVAAVGVAGNMMFVMLALTQMLGVGTTTMVSHAAGRKDQKSALEVFHQAMLLSGLVGLGFLILTTVTRGVYTNGLAADAGTARLASSYLAWFIPAIALQFVMVAIGAALRGTGLFQPGMVVQTTTVILNMVLAPFLIFGWVTHHPMGVAGAALATFIAVVVGTLWLALYFVPREAYLRFTPDGWKPEPGLWGRMLSIGLPAGMEFGLMAVYLVVVYAVSRPFGAGAQAGFGIGQRIIQAGFMPVVALGFSVAPVAGQNFGARHPERVRETFRSAVLISVAVMTLLALLCHVAPAAMVRVFSSDPEVVRIGEQYLRIVSWNFVASGVVFVASSMFQAMGNTLPSLAASFIRIASVVVPTLFLARVHGFELRWIWYLTVASVTVQMIVSLLLLQREFRLKLPGLAASPAPVPAAASEAPQPSEA